MEGNVGGMERPVRIGVGASLLVAAAFAGFSGAVMWVAMIVGGIVLVTGALGYCPAWTLLGINTCRTHGAGKKS